MITTIRNRSRVIRGAVVAAIAAAALTSLTAAPADAAGTYHENADGVAIRQSPDTGGGLVTRLNTGTAIVIDCQVSAQTVTIPGYGTSPIWDYVTSPVRGWQTDLTVLETPYAKPDPRLRNCNTPVSTREQRAVAWAAARVGQTGWNGWCERFAENAYGTTGRYGSALIDFSTQQAAGRMHYDLNPPAGALTFFRNAYDGGYGHVMLSRGDGSYISTGPTVRIVAASYGGRFIGWAFAPDSWPGV